jgi:lysophospholipase L1-like esterase
MRPLVLVLFTSLFVNLVGLAALVNVIQGRGGMRYLLAYFQKNPDANIDIAGASRTRMLEALPTPQVRPIVFLGDSLTAQCEWRELFGHRLTILNRGVGGDTSAGVLKRVSGISKLRPSAVFLMIGANDAQLIGYAPADTARDCRMIIDGILQSSGDTRIYIESLLPSRAPKFNEWSAEANRQIRQLADGKAVRFVDLRPAFLDANGLMDRRYAYDGLHLNVDGYLIWKRQIDPIIEELAKQ